MEDKTKAAAEVFNKNAVSYQNKFMDVSLYHESLDAFCRSITKKDAEILELACGPGNITKYLLDQRPDFKLFGTDLAPAMIELAKINNPTAQFELMDCRNIPSLSKKFDGIVCGFALPYLSEIETLQFIKDAANALNQYGILYLSTMEGDYAKSGYEKGNSGDEIFMHYYTAAFLINALEENGFTAIDLRKKTYALGGRPNITDLIIVAEKS